MNRPPITIARLLAPAGLLLAVAALVHPSGRASAVAVTGAASDGPHPLAVAADGRLRGREATRIRLPDLTDHQAWMITVTLEAPQELPAHAVVPVRVRVNDVVECDKPLHDGDPDLFVVLRGAANRAGFVEIGDGNQIAPFRADIRAIDLRSEQSVAAVIETEPNDSPESAVAFELSQTVFASADDRPYIAAPATDAGAAKDAGVDWYQFTVTASEPRLAYLSLDLIDREVPVDLAIFTMVNGKLEPYEPAFEKFEPEKTTRFAGMFKFVARRVTPGTTYYLRVRGNHPAYQLRSWTYPAPPYRASEHHDIAAAARQAVATATDYLLLKGDSWHANTPRVGGIDNRIQNVHAETAQCIACHPTHFTTRAAVFAQENGFPIRQRPSLEFLTERLYNNPRPFYGHPQAAWARMISASANVMTRLSIMLRLYEDNITGTARPDVHRAVAEYAKLYYKDRTEMPANETNGNLPLVSKFEVAEYSWAVLDRLHRETGDAAYRECADRVRRLIETADPAKHIQDMSDLCFQTTAWCRIDRDAYAERIRANVARIFELQRGDGGWPMRFGENELTAEFQTGHSLYTLAVAGVPASDPRVQNGVAYLLARQLPFGAWFDHDDPKKSNPYENFRTPFYESQFAVMALSRLYPHGDGPAGPKRAALATLSTDHWPALLAELDQLWDPPSGKLLQQAQAALGHPNVLVREAAARALGRVGDASAVEPLIQALGDGSKLVERAAAVGLRQLGNRGLAKPAITAALGSDDARVRRAALRVFAQHFRYWMDAGDARRTIVDRLMADPDPTIRMMASRALWQWWYWDADESVRGSIEDVLLARMAVEEHPWVRTNLIESFTNICDDNTRYLYNNWIALLGTQADREQATAGHHASGTRQGRKIAAALEAGDARQIEAILQAIGYFHLRTGTYASRGRFGRIGNDVEAIQFYGEVAPELKTALAPLVRSGEPGVRGPALLAAFTLRGTGSEDVLGVPFLRSLADPDEFARKVALEFHGSFLPHVDAATEPEVLETIDQLLRAPYVDSQRAALEVVGRLKFSNAGKPKLADSVRRFLAEGNDALLPQALRAAAGLPGLWKDATLIKQLGDAIQSENKELQQAGVRLALEADPLAATTLVRSRLDGVFASKEPRVRKSLLELAQASESLNKNPRVAHLITESMADGDASVRQLALELVRRSRDLQSNAAVRVSLAELLDDPNERTRQIAESLYSGKQLPRDDVNVAKLLDFEFFKHKVQPIFFAPGPDKKACVQCHHNHGILKISGSPEDGTPPDDLVRENYRAALRVVNLAEPTRSLILQKPLGSADAEGVVGTQSVPHGGELRWPERESSAEYQTILSWINGARVDAAAESSRP